MNESIHKPSSTGSNSSDTTCHTEDHDFQDMEKAYKGQNDDASTATEHVPLEMQAVQVNLNDPDMDLVRFLVLCVFVMYSYIFLVPSLCMILKLNEYS